MQRFWFKIALFNFLIAACIGALLRFAFVEEISWLTFRYWLHGHSHVAMLGWIYLGLFALLIHAFLPEEKQQSKFYNRLFWLTQISVLGMLISFLLQGYAAWSIGFSSMHIVLSYVFVWQFWKDLSAVGSRQTSSLEDNLPTSYFRQPAEQFIKASLGFLVLSTFAIWAMPPIIISGNAGSAFYYGAVQFYLHFQFNGWFIFAVLGLFFKLLENRGISMPLKLTNAFYWLLLLSCFLTFALAVTWSTPLPFLFLINSIGVSIQLAALISFLLIIKKVWREIRPVLSGWIRLLLVIAFLSFVLKIWIQTAVVIPYIATVAYTIRNYAIGFLHLMLLGMITSFILGYGSYRGLLNFRSSTAKIGLGLFLSGFIFSEAILFIQGTMFWGAMGFMPLYYELLFFVSLPMPLGIGILLIAQLRYRGVF